MRVCDICRCHAVADRCACRACEGHTKQSKRDEILTALEEAATRVAKTPGVDVSTTYTTAREVWALWWRRYRELNPGYYQGRTDT
jgi:hypothetical protein